MGYTHGKRWSDEAIKTAIKEVMGALEIKRMPSRKECEQHFRNTSLGNAVSRRKGGWYALAEEMGLPIKDSETYVGKRHEWLVSEMLRERGFEVEQMSQNFPYDLLVNDYIKVDVKASRLYRGKLGNFYSFNLEKRCATCDIYVLLALTDENEIKRVFIVPSKYVMKNTQISIGEITSKYRRFEDKWKYFIQMSEFLEYVL
jgi:hypothetical protein